MPAKRNGSAFKGVENRTTQSYSEFLGWPFTEMLIDLK
jgi:hypothetical protein